MALTAITSSGGALIQETIDIINDNAAASVTLTGTETLTNKTLTSPSVTGGAFTGTGPTGVMVTKVVSFTENATNTTHTGTVTIPAGAWLHDVRITSSVLWTGGSAVMDVGDTADPNGYFEAINLKATDLLVGEVLAINGSSQWGGKEGAYLVAATGRRGPTSSNFGQYYAAGSSILGTITVGTPATTAGRTFMSVTYSVGEVSAAVPSGS